jgi:CheY-like chemotaxis protein
VRVPPPPFATLRGLAVASRTRPTRDEVTLPRFHQTSRTAAFRRIRGISRRRGRRPNSGRSGASTTARDAWSGVIVEDEVDARELLQEVLEGSGYRVATAQDGVEALDIFRAQQVCFVVLDLFMPRLDGFEVLKALAGDPTLAKVHPCGVLLADRLQTQEEEDGASHPTPQEQVEERPTGREDGRTSGDRFDHHGPTAEQGPCQWYSATALRVPSHEANRSRPDGIPSRYSH